MEQQQVYKGRCGSERPTAQQQALLEKMGIRKQVIAELNRAQAFLLIRQMIAKYYGSKFERQHSPKIEAYLKW